MKSVNPSYTFLLFCRKPNGTMIDIDLQFLENILTDNRKEKFLKVLHRTNHFTIAVEDIFQMHNTSAVMRSCEVLNSRVKCNRTALRQKYR
jgi:tRNA G18 (ribose-2'-O)-methylase SpoU